MGTSQPFAERMARIENVLKLLGELDAGVEPTIREAELGMGVPSLGSAAWQTAERTGALALMEYVDVQRLADIYMLQALVSDNLKEALATVNYAGSLFLATDDPFSAVSRPRATPCVRACSSCARSCSSTSSSAGNCSKLRELRATLSGSTVPRPGSIALTLVGARP